MAIRNELPCKFYLCPNTTANSTRYCEEHEYIYREAEAKRKTNADLYKAEYSRLYNCTRWVKARAGYLRHHPLCVECEAKGKIMAANVVDHITPHKGDLKLFWDSNNWQALCTTCHNRKTAKEKGGFR